MTYLDEFLNTAARIPGVRVGEHPRFGGVTPGAHMVGSMHDRGRAGDLNYGPPRPGAPADEVAILLQLAAAARAFGLNVIYTPWRPHPIKKTAAAHWDHLHVDDGPITSYQPPPLDPATARRILTALTPPTPAPSPVPDVQEDDMRDTIAAIYRVELLREAKPAEIDYWLVQAAARQLTAHQVWQEINGSREGVLADQRKAAAK